MKRILFLAVVFALFTTAASAQVRRNAIQHHRIHNGVRSGELTRNEKFRLHKDRIRYSHAKRRAFHDGKLTRTERKRLHHMNRFDSRRIYAMKHNGRRRMQ